MKTLRRTLLVLLAALVLQTPPTPALADGSAPPPPPGGGDVNTGGFETNVQMVSEEVLITIESVYSEEYGSYYPRAHVDATFYMVNQGDEIEAFDVWFPLGFKRLYFDDDYNTVGEFAAWVNDTPAEIDFERIEYEEESGYFLASSLWATWPATFYPGQMVTLHVAYHQPGNTGYPFSYFEYVLHTGASWYDSIGEGTITVRLPYEVNELNVVWDAGPRPEYYTVSGSEVIWTFSDLEPTEDDDIGISVLAPHHWLAIQEAEQVAQANPDDVQAQLALASALKDALTFERAGMRETEINDAFSHMALEAYERALELSPDNVEIYVGYLELLSYVGPIAGETVARAPGLLELALALAPDNSRLLELEERLNWLLPRYQPTPTRTPFPRPVTTTPMPATETPEPSSTPTITPVPATETPEPSPIPTATPSPTPEPADESPPQRGIFYAAGGVIVILALVVWGIVSRRQKSI